MTDFRQAIRDVNLDLQKQDLKLEWLAKMLRNVRVGVGLLCCFALLGLLVYEVMHPVY